MQQTLTPRRSGVKPDFGAYEKGVRAMRTPPFRHPPALMPGRTDRYFCTSAMAFFTAWRLISFSPNSSFVFFVLEFVTTTDGVPFTP